MRQAPRWVPVEPGAPARIRASGCGRSAPGAAAVVSWIVAALLPAADAAAQVPAFPGAEGPGKWAVGGRGGAVFEVTNLDDAGPGSLRAAISASGPRTVVFRVGGTIELASPLAISHPNLTVAGQTAPGGGITLKGDYVAIEADHVIFRYVRVRPGYDPSRNIDAISVWGAVADIIVDHCSASWGSDETLSVGDPNGQTDRVTVQWCIISESLRCPSCPNSPPGYASLVRGAFGSQYAYHHNLFAHNGDRNPRPGNYFDAATDPEGFDFDFRNNVLYDWYGRRAGYTADTDSITRKNFIRNVYLRGLDSTDDVAWDETCPFDRGYFFDNSMDGVVPGDPWSLIHFFLTTDQIAGYKLASPVVIVDMPTDSLAVTYDRVLGEAGASIPGRDAIDVRIVDDVRNGTGHNIANESEVGGWPAIANGDPPPDADHDGMPDAWETARGLDPGDASDRNADRDSDGYTNLEEYLNGIPWSAPGGPDGGTGPTADAAPGPADGASPPQDGAGSPTDAGVPPDAGSSSTDGPPGGSHDGVSGGCGCRAAPGPGAAAPPGLLCLLGLLYLAARRRARRPWRSRARPARRLQGHAP